MKIKSEKKAILWKAPMLKKIIKQCEEFVRDCSDGFLITSFKERLDTLHINDENKIQEYIEKNKKQSMNMLKSLSNCN